MGTTINLILSRKDEIDKTMTNNELWSKIGKHLENADNEINENSNNALLYKFLSEANENGNF